MNTKVSPWRLLGYAGLHLLMFLPVLLVFVLVLVGAVTAVITVGLPLLLLLVPAQRALAEQHRSIAGRILVHEMPAGYLPTAGLSPMHRLRTWALDPMTWRELAWAPVSLTLGFTISLLSVVLLLPLVTAALWWYAIGPMMTARAVVDRWFLTRGHTETLEQRVVDLTVSRAETVDHSAAELRRIERDLHDGAQARLVSLGMSLGMADDLFANDPETARKLVAEARETTGAALGDLRSVVRGIHPPVLADRGLSGAVQALALDMAIPVEVSDRLAGRPPAPVESAVYFAVAECLANVGKHSGARNAWVEIGWAEGRLVTVVGDDGTGGADPDAGSGMRGVMRRLAAFDGTMSVASPDRGPTIVTLEVPCVLSSPRTTPSSGTG